MKKALVIVLVAVAAMAASGALAGSRIIAASGIVRVSPPAPAGSEQFAQAAVGQPLVDGSIVMTAENGRVTIEVSPGNIVRLRGDTRIVVGAPRGQTTRFRLIAGKLRGVFGRLTGNERFEVEFASMSAVASVKGTTFEAADGSGGISLRTVFGAIDMIFSNSTQSIPQGCGMFTGAGGVLQVRPLTEAEIQDAVWGDSGSPQGDRSDLHAFVEGARDAAAAQQEIVVQVREDDFAVGRSLRDVHGNLARVDQRLIRPAPDTIQFVNLVKRDSYVYAGRFSYSGPSGVRYDYLEGLVRFNVSLPDSIVDWPAFFVNNDNVEPVYGRVMAANGRAADPGRDIVMRVTTFQDNETDFVYILNGTDNLDNPPAAKRYIVGDEVTHSDGSDAGSLWATSIQTMFPVAADTDLDGTISEAEASAAWATHLELRLEAYGLNENGGILNINDFTSDSLNGPFGLLRSVAVESVISIADANGGQFFGRSNIDLIVIPDLVVAIVQRYGISMAQSLNSSN